MSPLTQANPSPANAPHPLGQSVSGLTPDTTPLASAHPTQPNAVSPTANHP